jgi:hypothetical protein
MGIYNINSYRKRPHSYRKRPLVVFNSKRTLAPAVNWECIFFINNIKYRNQIKLQCVNDATILHKSEII